MKPRFFLVFVSLLGYYFQNALGNDDLGITLEDTSSVVCNGENAYFTFADILGNPESLHIEFLEEEAFDNGFENTVIQFSEITNSTFFILVPDTASAGTYEAELYVQDDEQTSTPLTISITIVSEPYAGEYSTLYICEGEFLTRNDLLEALGEPDTMWTWEPMITEGEEVSIGTYTYIVSDTSECNYGDDIASITVKFFSKPYAGENDTIFICEDDSLTRGELLDALGEPDTMWTWEPKIADGEKVSIGTYTYTVSDTSDCNYGDDIASITVKFFSKPYAGENDTIFICEGDSLTSVELFDALGGADTTGTWETDIPETIGEGTYVYIVESTCTEEDHDTARIVIEAIEKPYPGNSDTLYICLGDFLTKDDLVDALGEADPGSWIPKISDKTKIRKGSYEYIVSSEHCPGDTATVLVDEISLPEMASIIAKPAVNVSVIIFPDSVTIEQIVVIMDSTSDTLELDEGRFLYIEPKYRIAEYVFIISFHVKDGCSNVVEYTYAELAPVSIKEFTTRKLKESDYILFPTPANNRITIELHPTFALNGSELWVTIYSLSGSCVLEAKLEGDHQSINIEQLKAGAYIVQLSSSEVVFKSKKLIISR